MIEYPWYCAVDVEEPLEQGDFIDACPVLVPLADINDVKIKADVIEYDVIILSQSCDLYNKKIDLVLVCPYYSLVEAETKYTFLKSAKMRNALRKGHIVAHHLLNECIIDGFQKGYIVVDFRDVYGIPYEFLIGLSKKHKKRLRLLPPYKEHLSQAFARFFMRVGLPIDIPEFKSKKSSS